MYVRTDLMGKDFMSLKFFFKIYDYIGNNYEIWTKNSKPFFICFLNGQLIRLFLQ